MTSGRFQPRNSRSIKISNEQVFEILDKYFNQNYTQGRLAREYGVNKETIGRYIRRESRTQVPMPANEDPMAILQRAYALQESLKLGNAPVVKAEKEINRFMDVKRGAAYGAVNFQGDSDDSIPSKD